MALNDQAYDSSGGEEDPWELIDDDDETTPLAAPQNSGATAAVPDDSIGEVAEINGEGQFRRLDADASDRVGDGGEIGGESFTTAVSTITASDHHETGDGNAKEGEDGADDAQEGNDSLALGEDEQGDVLAAYYDEKLMRWVFPLDDAAGAAELMAPPLTDDEKTEKSLSTVESDKDLDAKAASVPLSDPVADLAEKTDGEKSEDSALVDSLVNMGFEKGLVEKTIEDLRLARAKKIDHESVIDGMAAADSPEEDEEKSENSKLVESLANMGFERERIEQAIEALYQEGAKEIDEDAVIEMFERKKNDDGRPWDPFVEISARDLRRKNRLLRRRTRRVARDVGLSARELWTNVRGESARFRADFLERRDEAAAEVRQAATSAGVAVRRANEEYRITDTLATAAVVGGATLLALGNPRAGVGVIAAAGATLAAGEAMKKSSARSGSTYTRDYGLGEGLHID